MTTISRYFKNSVWCCWWPRLGPWSSHRRDLCCSPWTVLPQGSVGAMWWTMCTKVRTELTPSLTGTRRTIPPWMESWHCPSLALPFVAEILSHTFRRLASPLTISVGEQGLPFTWGRWSWQNYLTNSATTHHSGTHLGF